MIAPSSGAAAAYVKQGSDRGCNLVAAPAWSHKNIENAVGHLLRAGVFLSALVVFCGAVIFLIRHGHSPANDRVFQGDPESRVDKLDLEKPDTAPKQDTDMSGKKTSWTNHHLDDCHDHGLSQQIGVGNWRFLIPCNYRITFVRNGYHFLFHPAAAFGK